MFKLKVYETFQHKNIDPAPRLNTCPLIASCSSTEEIIEEDSQETITDARDGKVYNVVTIGYQKWLAENMNYLIGNSWCYNDDNQNCLAYGRLYDWESAILACPEGWRLATRAEWQTLIVQVGGESIAGGQLKSTSSLWQDPNTGARNGSGFTGLPAGKRVAQGKVFNSINYSGFFWTSTIDIGAQSAWYRTLNYSDDDTSESNQNTNTTALSCRCIIDKEL